MGSKLAQYINKHITGNVYNDEKVLEAYATDRSILRIEPKLVAFPDNSEDVRRLLNFANQLAERGFKLPVAVRGSGLDKTGADLTDGMVITTERMTAIKALDVRGRLVHVEAGVTIGALNAALKMRGLCLPIGVDSHETIGGLIANAPTDTYAAKYGGIMNYVERVEMVLASGDKMQVYGVNKSGLKRIAKDAPKQAKIYRNVKNELKNAKEQVAELKNTADSVGYAGAAYVERKDMTDLTALLYGSQGTLAVVTEVILRLELLPAKRKRVAVKVSNLRNAQKYLDEVMTFAPERVEILDGRILYRSEEMGKGVEIFSGIREGDFAVVMEFAGSKKKLQKVLKAVSDSAKLPKNAKVVVENVENTELFNDLENALAAYLNDGKDRAALLDGVYLPNKNLAEFISRLKEIEEAQGAEMAIFGSYATECYNVRPGLNVADAEGRKQAVLLMSEYANLVKSLGGSLTGGTPEGRVKAMVTNHRLSDEEKELFRKLKEIFDPNGVLNPDIKTFASTKHTIGKMRKEALIGENR